MRSALTWLHLSDIHFNLATEWSAENVRTSLIDYLDALFKGDESLYPDLVFCTGDIAYGETGSSPLKDQYAKAKIFFDRILEICGRPGAPLPHDRLFVVPGNHDVNRRSIDSDAQATLTRWASDAQTHINEINQRFNDRTTEFKNAIKRLDEYSEFVSDYLPHQHDADGRHHYARVVEIDDLSVGIVGLNSAWSCAGPEDDRNLWLPAEWQFNAAARTLGNKAHLKIGIVHHPVAWLNAADRTTTSARISTDVHFYLHGHEHHAWVEPTQSHVMIAAGAVGTNATDEFGINITRIDLEKSKGTVHLHGHKAGTSNWISAPVGGHAPSGQWDFDLPVALRRAPALAPALAPLPVATKRSSKLYGRETLIKNAVAKLDETPFLFVYGFRGNGKTALIQELGARSPLAHGQHVRIVAKLETTADDLFRELAGLLGETAELPKTPAGNASEIAKDIALRYSAPSHAWIWIDRAHNLLDAQGFRHQNVRDLLTGLRTATSWHWVLEMRERPPQDLIGIFASECEVTGLRKEALQECLADAAPDGRETDWRYSGKPLKDIFSWLGGGHGAYAHPHAIQLLIEVARGRNETPLEVHERHRSDFEQRVEDVLLADLYDNVLVDHERRLLQALALYRAAIPHDHMDALEDALDAKGALDSLYRRCLLTSSPSHEQFYLHGLIANWIRIRKLGYTNGESDDAGFTDNDEKTKQDIACELHAAIASCWLNQLGHSRRITNVNITRALEAFHHLIAADDPARVQSIAVELLSGDLEWARKRMKAFQERLFTSRAPLAQQCEALEYRAVLDPDDHSVQRFLGECYQKIDGRASRRAVACFETACKMRRDFPQYWANLGISAIARGPDAVSDYLMRLDSLQADCPEAIDDYVRAIQADCLGIVGALSKAAVLRMARISAGTANSAIYADEAKARLDAKDYGGALDVLDLATKNAAASEYTEAIRASVLQRTDPSKAAVLRMARISAGTTNSAFYADEAKARLDAKDYGGALDVLDLATKNAATSEYTEAIRASVLQRTDPSKAAALRMARISAGTTHSAFYADEARARLDAKDYGGALDVLDLAAKNAATSEYTEAIRASILQRTDPSKAAALRMARISAGTTHSAFYADEARARLDAEDYDGALDVLDLAAENAAANEYTEAIRASVPNRKLRKAGEN
ncbi:MAG: hypothetical protein HOP03_02480 [Lysobacter sp.]|nr:hypothetical protein [Lysobacter sp.]